MMMMMMMIIIMNRKNAAITVTIMYIYRLHFQMRPKPVVSLCLFASVCFCCVFFGSNYYVSGSCGY